MQRLCGPLRRRLLSTSAASSLPAFAAVTNPLHKFFHILDGTSRDPLSSLFASAARMHVVKAGLLLTGDEVDAWCARMQKTWNGAATLHTEGNIVLEAKEPGVIVNHSTWTALVNGELISYGTHEDVLEEAENGEWLFQRRVVRHLYAKA